MELTIDSALQKGIEAHKAGDIQEADRFYTAILRVKPYHPDANHNMGVLAVGIGKIEEALPFFKKALEANNATTQFWVSYIDALVKLGKINEARSTFDQATDNGIKGEALDKLKKILNKEEPIISTSSNNPEPSQKLLQPLLILYNQKKFPETLEKVIKLSIR